MNDNHGRIAAGLHIAIAVFDLLVLAAVALFLGGTAALVGDSGGADVARVAGFIGAILGALLAVLALVSVAQLVAGILYLRGSPAARLWLVVFSAFMLLHFPFGTAVGAYSLWALLRPEAIPQGRP